MSTSSLYRPVWNWGDKIRKTRRDTGLSQRAFAESIGVKAPTIAAWEASHTVDPPRGGVAAAKRIRLAHGVDVDWLLGLDEDDHSPHPTGGPGPLTADHGGPPVTGG